MSSAGVIENASFELCGWFVEEIGRENHGKIFSAAVIRVTAPAVFHKILVSFFGILQSAHPPFLGKMVELVEMDVV